MTGPPAGSPEPPKRHPVFVHVGAAKTGTTYLQTLFAAQRENLRADGFLYPPCGSSGHVLETLDLRGIEFKGVPDPRIAGSWRRAAGLIRRWNGPALLSCELLAPARRPQIQRLVRSLDPAEVHILMTVRDLARQLPAAWQERVKNRGLDSFEAWLAAVREPETATTDAGRRFWSLHDVDQTLARWSEFVPPERVHVVTVPASSGDRSLLWKRFAQVVGLDADRYPEPGATVNSSLGAAEVSLVRHVNIAIGGEAFPWPEYDRLLKWYLSPELARRRGAPIDLPEDDYEWAVARSRQMVQSIAAAGFDVVGDLDELIPSGRPTGMNPDRVPGDLEADAGVAGIVSLLDLLVQEGAEVGRLRAEVEASQGELATARDTIREHRELAPRERVKRCLVEVSEQVPWLGHARRGYTKVRRRRRSGRR